MQGGGHPEFGLGMVANEPRWIFAEFWQEPLDKPLVFFSLVVDHRHGAVRVKLFEMDHFLVKMRAQVKAGEHIVARLQQDQDLVLCFEVSQESTPSIRVEATDGFVVPDLPGTKGAYACLFQFNFAHRKFGHQVASCSTAFDADVTEINVKLDLFQPCLGPQKHGNHFRLAIGVGREVQQLGLGRPFGDGVFSVAGDACDIEPLHQALARGPIQINGIVRGAFVAALPHCDIQEVLAKEGLGRNLADFHGPVASEHNDVVDVRAISQKFSLCALEACAHKPLFRIPIQLGVGHGHFAAID